MIKICLAQISPKQHMDSILKTIESYVIRSSELGCNLLVFPEMTMGVFSGKNTPYNISSHLDNFLEKLIKLSTRFHIDIICPIWEGDKLTKKAFNSIVLITKDEVSLLYRKLHLFDALGFNESEFVIPGKYAPPVINYMGFNVSFSICYDLRFPELYRYQSEKNTDLSIVCAGWYLGTMKEEHLHALLRARAIENTMYVACANLCGDGFCGRSVAFDPFGVMLCDAGEDENLITFLCNKKRIESIRKKLPSLRHRRFDIFRPYTE